MDYKILITRLISGFVIISTLIFLLFYSNININIFINVIYLFIFLEVFLFFKENKYLYIMLVYLSTSLILSNIYFLYYFDILQIILFIFLITIFDSSSYFFGTVFGKKKIFKNISKNKTFVGLFSGFIVSFVISFYLNSYFSIYNNIVFIFFSSLVLIFSFAGDIIESYFKRISNIKDSSFFIPGHGGFFDRFDSYVCSIYFFSIFSIFY
jgi:phosphatidate cytidylyltransferase